MHKLQLINGFQKSGKLHHIIYQFFPKVPPGYKIFEASSNIVYLPINIKTIASVTVTRSRRQTPQFPKRNHNDKTVFKEKRVNGDTVSL